MRCAPFFRMIALSYDPRPVLSNDSRAIEPVVQLLEQPLWMRLGTTTEDFLAPIWEYRELVDAAVGRAGIPGAVVDKVSTLLALHYAVLMLDAFDGRW